MTEETRESSFDELTRGLARGSISRGKALRLMGAALLGGTLASLGIGEAAAAPIGCKRNGKKCKNGTQCCSEVCTDGTCAACPPGTKLCSNGQCASCCADTDCSGCETCQSGTCACPEDTATVLANGTCARRCTGGASCSTGFCYGTNEGTFCAGGGSVGGCLGLGNGGCPPGSLCSGLSCLTVTC
jgi:hypothetical protein